MSDPDATWWTLIDAAAAGQDEARATFARRYLPVVRAYLGARWRHHALRHEVDDAAQDVFLDILREDGALGRADRGRGAFRAFLYGVVRTVALRCERRLGRRREQPSDGVGAEQPSDEPDLAAVFDRAWTANLLDLAVHRHRERAAGQGEVGRRRVELLRLRFWEDLPIREIARRWALDPRKVHREYERARRDFRRALEEVLRWNDPDNAAQAATEARRLVGLIP